MDREIYEFLDFEFEGLREGMKVGVHFFDEKCQNLGEDKKILIK